MKTLDWFRERSEIDQVTGCWLWRGALHPDGYAVAGGMKAHRIAFQIANGSTPAGQPICHHCDRRTCVNPEHLYLGTAKSNAADRSRRGRHRMPSSGVRGVMKIGNKFIAQYTLYLGSYSTPEEAGAAVKRHKERLTTCGIG